MSEPTINAAGGIVAEPVRARPTIATRLFALALRVRPLRAAAHVVGERWDATAITYGGVSVSPDTWRQRCADRYFAAWSRWDDRAAWRAAKPR